MHRNMQPAHAIREMGPGTLSQATPCRGGHSFSQRKEKTTPAPAYK